MSDRFSNTYWNSNGKYQSLADKLQSMIPHQGQVENPRKNKALERFRKASNCYYDLYTNGLWNRSSEFRKVFGFSAKKAIEHYIPNWVIEQTEQKMDEIIMDAVVEQNIFENMGLTN